MISAYATEVNSFCGIHGYHVSEIEFEGEIKVYSIQYHSEMTGNDIYFSCDSKNKLLDLEYGLFKAFRKSIDDEDFTTIFAFCDDNKLSISDDKDDSKVVIKLSFRF